MALAIGTFTPTYMRGSVGQAKQKGVDIFTRPGIAGIGVMVDAVHPREITIETDTLDTKANCQTALSTAAGIVGTVVSVTDDTATTYDNCAVVSVSVVLNQYIKGSAGWILRLSWTIYPDTST